MNKKICFIVDGFDLTNYLLKLIENFVGKYQVVEYKPIEKMFLQDMVISCFHDLINEFLIYTNGTRDLEQMLKDIFPWFETTYACYNKKPNEYWLSVALKKEVINQMKKVVLPYRTMMNIQPYDVWEVTYINGADRRSVDIRLIKQGDFRIMDWERRMKSGEWKPN